MPFTAEELIRRWDSAKGKRGNWEYLWRDASRWILTRRMPIAGTIHPGADRDLQVFDSTAMRSLEKLSAGLFSYMCPPNEVWFKLRSSHREVMEDELAIFWYDHVSTMIREALYMSNFVVEIHEAFMDLGAFGTANMYESEGMEMPLTFRCIHINDYWIDENSELRVDTVFRRINMTVRQMVQEFGTDSLDGEAKKCYEMKDGTGLDRVFEILHVVMPRMDANPTKMSREHMAFLSAYVDVANRKFLSMGGYRENPYMVARFTKAPNEVYGRGPGQTMMPEIKLLNKMKKTVLLAAERVVDPPMLIPDDGVIGPVKTTPGALIHWRNNAFGNKPEELMSRANVPIGIELLNQERIEIERGFYVDLFEQLARRKAEMTATEVVERVREKLVLIAPAIGRLQQELFSPMIHRAFRILDTLGAIPPPPPSVAQYPQYEVYYVSKLAMAIKALEIDATQETLATVVPLAQYDPGVLDTFNWEAITRGTAHRNGMPAEFLHSPAVVAQMRQQKQQIQQAQQAAALAQQVADVAKTAKEAGAGPEAAAPAGAGRAA